MQSMALSLSLTFHSHNPHATFRLRPCFTKTSPLQNPKNGRFLFTRASGENSVSISDRERPVINGVNGSLEKYLSNGNGGVVRVTENGASKGSSLNYVNSNDVAEVKQEKKTVEEIGQEEAWFKKGGRGQLQVE
uniref:Uncharacterized protein n=1 Tax=Opuntia streptacantha TaxID=393608 RepID=A0A7C9D4K0_OPUST